MKKIVFSILGIIIFYYATFLLLGGARLAAKIKNDCHSSYNTFVWKDSINIFSSYEFSPSQYLLIASAFENSRKVVEVKDMMSLGKYFNSAEHFNYILHFEFTKFSPYQVVKEDEKIFEYGASWRKTYLWCFVTWIKIEDESTGIS